MTKVPLREKIGYGVGAIGLDLSYGLFYSYLSLYLTNALGIKPAFLLILAPLARIWDGVNDPMMGTLVDRTRTKMGRYRPWILTGAILNGIVLALMFNNNMPAGSVRLYVYVAVFYVLWGMTNTLADIPFWSMIPSFATEEKDRNLVSTIARTFSGLGQGIVSILTAIIVAAIAGVAGSDLDEMGASALKKGFGGWSIIAAIALVFFACISVISTKETLPENKNEEKFSFGKALKMIRHNDQLLIFMLFAMISNCGYYMTSGISSYYFLQVRGDLTMQSKFNLLGSVGSVLSILVIPICSKFMTNRSTYRFSLTCATIGYAGMAAVGYFTAGNVYALGACYLVASLGIGSMFVNQTVMLADIVDYGEYKLGTRNQSLTFSMKGFLQKMAYTLQSIIMYAAFVATKYDFSSGTSAAKAVSNPAADSAISFMMFIVPPVMLIISQIIFSRKYTIYGDFKREILDAVSAKKAELAE
ncbi:MAG: MFS transporter [Clostridia bacterium]|nr:MFS transporter [Clostridia bacterium]